MTAHDLDVQIIISADVSIDYQAFSVIVIDKRKIALTIFTSNKNIIAININT